jgi:S-DNA-T family DNA segregation ATPase FtsK/SpoIIIE
MAKKNTTQSKKTPFLKKVRFVITHPTTTFFLGLLLGALAIFICSSFLSFFSSGGADQSVIDAATDAAATATVENSSGKGGAVVADFLINGCFGWSSVLVVPLLVVPFFFIFPAQTGQ